MTVNKEAIQKTIDLMVKDEKIRLNMVDWIRPDTYDEKDTNWCGTTACIAGYVIISEMGGKPFYKYEHGSYSEFAAKSLNISYDDGVRLFYPPTQEAWGINKDQAIRLLEHLRDYGKVDWSVIGFYNLKNEEDEL